MHQYKLNNYNIIIDTYSGSIHSVDSVAYDMIEMYESFSKEEVINTLLKKYNTDNTVTLEDLIDCYADITTLKENGQLFSKDDFQAVSEMQRNENAPIKAMCLHVAHVCNLCCEYCFAGKGEYKGEKALMSYDVGKRAFDFLIENSVGRTNLEVDFFGGEPLMNMDVVKDLVSYARTIEKDHNKNFRFTITTNGVLIDSDFIEFVNKEMDNVVLSLDGRKEIHDKYRVDSMGRGSYDNIIPKFKELIESRNGKGYYIRGTFTRNNLDFLEDIKHMAELGFKELSIEPVVCDAADPTSLREDDLEVLYEQYEKLALLMADKQKEGSPFNFYHYTLDLGHGPCVQKRISGCGVGTEYLAVTPTGELYPCHQFVGDEDMLMGNIWDGVKRKDIRNSFQNTNLYTKEECKTCWANLYCSGGCLANAYHQTNDINGLYEYGCKLFKKRMECAIMLKIMESDES